MNQITAARAAGHRFLRRKLFEWLERALCSDDGRVIAARALAGHLHRPDVPLEAPDALANVYPELPVAANPAVDALSPIFITGRFRSGSTLLWNLFRNLPNMTAYYEPLNERRWWDAHNRGSQIDRSHKGVEEYWTEYEGLDQLDDYYDESWIDTELYMNEHAYNPAMERFIQLLIDRAKGRPVLQFNRVDLRIPWLRRTFPTARVLHVYRHPRDQWCSTLGRSSFPPDGTVKEFAAHDGYYLLRWCRDLRRHFPFLDESFARHPYELFYYLWKLSYLFGRRYADHSVAFERLLANPTLELSTAFRSLGLIPREIDRILPLIQAPELGRWQRYADGAWFREIEERCESVLARFKSRAAIGI